MHLSMEDFYSYDLPKMAFAQRAVILLDGKMVNCCIEADEENGFVVKYKTAPSGWVIMTTTEGEAQTEKLTGHVQIIDPLEKQQ